ncbi:C-type lectin domain family 2 member A-like [Tachyglossus aculeatus]|uniref:C-type lectin domain family 2 member A-like n=1 Tax=Tachyglossus aculeatus TaxID=9261 RepID=UPI0018F43107|nr:C-type lectin domain family 2 member A-like [Tachyglossus aculeatus]
MGLGGGTWAQPGSWSLSRNVIIGLVVGVIGLIVILGIVLGVTLGGKKTPDPSVPHSTTQTQSLRSSPHPTSLPTLPPPPPPTPTPTLFSTPSAVKCSSGWLEVNEMCFFLSTETKDWEGSKNSCKGNQVTLAKMTSMQLEYLKTQVGTSDYWIGLSKKSDSDWRWIDGSALNNMFAIRGAGDCAYLDSSSVNSAGCSQPRRWICSGPLASSSG